MASYNAKVYIYRYMAIVQSPDPILFLPGKKGIHARSKGRGFP